MDLTVNGILAQGTIETPEANNDCGWADLAAVVTTMEAGDTYVNVHTLQNAGGEIRGQILPKVPDRPQGHPSTSSPRISA